MSKYSKEQLDKINNLATDFTKCILREYPQNNMCFTVSYPLSLYLENLGYENQIVCGSYKNELSPKNGTPHFWLQLYDDLNTIIDPTFSQFDNSQFRVIVEEKPKELVAIPFRFEEWFFEVYQRWKDKLLGVENPFYYPEQSNRDSLDLVMLLTINLNAATILYSRTKEYNKVHSDVYEKYFDCIFIVIREYYGKNEWSQIIFEDGFNDLLDKAIAG
jgi:hypothetical protein